MALIEWTTAFLLCTQVLSASGQHRYYAGAADVKLVLWCDCYCEISVEAENFSGTYLVSPDNVTVVSLPDELEVRSSLERRKGVRVTSNDSLSVVMFQGKSDAYRVLPHRSFVGSSLSLDVVVKVSLSYGGDVLSVTVGVEEGSVDGAWVSVEVTVGKASVAYDVRLTEVVVSHTTSVNLTCLAPNRTLLTSVTVLLNTSDDRVVLPDGNFTTVLGDVFSEPSAVDFVIGEFTRLTLLVTACLVGGVVLVLSSSVAGSVLVGVVCYRRGKRWRVSGAHGFSPRGDTLSVSTTDPGTYELMNRLGESKTTSFLINDDRDFARL